MPTANEILLDAALRHAIGVNQYAAGEAGRVKDLLEKADQELVVQLRTSLGKVKGGRLQKRLRTKALLADMNVLRKTVMADYRTTVRDKLYDLSAIEATREVKLLDGAVPVEFSFAAADAGLLRATVTSDPFHGQLLKDWFSALSSVDQRRLKQAVQLGIAEGESIDAIVRRVAGTRANGYTDGVLAMTRRNAESVVRTAVLHVSNAARQQVWTANSDVVELIVWVSTLDGRTTPICRSRDGKVTTLDGSPVPAGYMALVPAGARPPAHYNCRSTTVGMFSSLGLLGKRPFVVDTRTPRKRTVDFRREARAQGKSIQQVRKEWSDANVGQVPSKTTYQEFLTRQSGGFQDSVLGKAKGKLFREGGLTVDHFVNDIGKELTLDQLRVIEPEAFVRAGL